MEVPPPFPRGADRMLRACALVAAAAIVILPVLPDELFLARDAASGAVILFNRSHGLPIPLHLGWWWLGWQLVEWPLRLACAFAVALPALWPVREPGIRPRRLSVELSPRLWPWIAAAGAGALFLLLPVDPALNRAFGDGAVLFDQVRNGAPLFPAEPLTMALLGVIGGLLETRAGGRPQPAATIAIAVAGTGAAFAAALAWLAAGAARESWRRAALFFGVLLTGGLAQFFCYVETTFLVIAAAGWFLAGAVRALGAPAGREGGALAIAFGGLGVAVGAHTGAVSLIPAGLALVLLAPRRGRNGLLFALLVLLPFAAGVLLPFWMRGRFGNAGGGADSFIFVPLDYEAARRQSSHVYYAMFSLRHAADIAAAMIVAAPFALPLIGAAPFLRRRANGRSKFVVLALAAAGALAIPLLWDFDFGAWGDWNLVAAYLFPLNLFAWFIFLERLDCYQMPAGFGRRTLFPLILAQALLGLGLQLQLYSIGA